MKCYLVTNRHKSWGFNDWLLFWRADSKGYTNDIRYAGMYNVDEKNPDYPIMFSKNEAVCLKKDDYYIPCDLLKTNYTEFHLIEK